MPVPLKKYVVATSVTKTVPITNKSNAVNGIIFPFITRPKEFTGVGNPRSSAAQIIPAAAWSTPSIPSEAMTGIVERIAGLSSALELLFLLRGRITKRSTSAPSNPPETSATTNAIQYE